MKLTVKTLAGKQLPIEVEDPCSVIQLKQKIEAEHQLKAETLKLIAYGKVLDNDEKQTSDYGIKDGDFIVAMQQKAKPAPKKKAEEPKKEETKAEEPVTSNSATAVQPPATTTTAQTTAPQTSTQPAQSQPASTAASGMNLPPQVESAITELISISGQSRENCIRALAMAQNQPDLAFEILLQGLPSEEEIAAMGSGGDAGYGEEADANPGAPGGNPAAAGLTPAVVQQLQALVSNPGFPAIRQRLLTDQDFTAMFMQNLQQQQPDIYAAIQANPQILVMLLQGSVPSAGGAGAGAGGMAGAGGAGGAGAGGHPPGTIQVTQEEHEAIKRLETLGFSRVRAAEAYFACDKNEEHAANFLFESGMEDESSAMQAAIQASQQPAQPAPANPNPPVAEAQPAEAQPAAQEQPAAAEGGEQQQDANMDSSNQNQQPPEGGNDGAGAGGAGAGGDGGSSLL